MRRTSLVIAAAAAALCGLPSAGAQVGTASLPAAPPLAPPPLHADPPAPERTPIPKAAEWAAAGKVTLTRTGPAAADCAAYRVREWLRIRCPNMKAFGISLLGGSAEGVAFWIDPPHVGTTGEVQLPLRRGDRRVVQFWTAGTDAQGNFTPKPVMVVQEHWLEGDAAPIVTAM